MNIGNVSEITGLSIDTLRYYEKIGLIRDIHRDRGGRRDFSETDLKWIEFIKRLKETDMPLKEIKIFADLRLWAIQRWIEGLLSSRNIR